MEQPSLPLYSSWWPFGLEGHYINPNYSHGLQLPHLEGEDENLHPLATVIKLYIKMTPPASLLLLSGSHREACKSPSAWHREVNHTWQLHLHRAVRINVTIWCLMKQQDVQAAAKGSWDVPIPLDLDWPGFNQMVTCWSQWLIGNELDDGGGEGQRTGQKTVPLLEFQQQKEREPSILGLAHQGVQRPAHSLQQTTHSSFTVVFSSSGPFGMYQKGFDPLKHIYSPFLERLVAV